MSALPAFRLVHVEEPAAVRRSGWLAFQVSCLHPAAAPATSTRPHGLTPTEADILAVADAGVPHKVRWLAARAGVSFNSYLWSRITRLVRLGLLRRDHSGRGYTRV